jgi:hypothetical protein
MTHMIIKHKNFIFEPGKKHLFLDISSTNIDTPVPASTGKMASLRLRHGSIAISILKEGQKAFSKHKL